jgi:hypothetical protein
MRFQAEPAGVRCNGGLWPRRAGPYSPGFRKKIPPAQPKFLVEGGILGQDLQKIYDREQSFRVNNPGVFCQA